MEVTTNELLVLTKRDIHTLLDGRDDEVYDAVKHAYECHALGRSVVPHSVFVRPPHQPRDRFIALSALLQDETPIAGVKWIASFPNNIHLGRERASSAILISSTTTGEPCAVLEGSVISARRTAASAALAAATLHRKAHVSKIALIGSGVIQREILRFVTARMRAQTVYVFDLDMRRARAFVDANAHAYPNLTFEIAGDSSSALEGAEVVSFATTALEPHVPEDCRFALGATVLHISLRDLPPQLLLSGDNIVDDPDHALREGTSLALLTRELGHARFVRSTLGDILLGRDPARIRNDGVTFFSPFGLGVLDLAVCSVVLRHARTLGVGAVIPEFNRSNHQAHRTTQGIGHESRT